MRHVSILCLVLMACAPAENGGSPTPTPSPSPAATPSVFDPRTENAALYDDLADALETATGGSRQALVDEFWSELVASGGAPARANGRLVFTLRSALDGWSVAGTFNDWTPGATPLVRITGTDTLAADVAVAPGR